MVGGTHIFIVIIQTCKSHCCSSTSKLSITTIHSIVIIVQICLYTKSHVHVHDSGITDFKYNCIKCGKGWMIKQSLGVHMDRHNNVRHFKCNICNKRFYSQSQLTNHLRNSCQSVPKSQNLVTEKQEEAKSQNLVTAKQEVTRNVTIKKC